MQRLNINAVPDGFPQVLYYSQGDVGRQFIINVEDYEIPSGAVVKIQATKPSGLGFSVTGTVSNNSVTFTTTAEMTDEAGRYPAELQITSGTTVIGTANITMCGEPNPHPDGTTDGQIGTIIPELTVLVEEIRNSNAKVESMTASAVPLSSGSDPTAQYDSENNELIFGIPTAEVDEEDLLKLYIRKTASGAIATITDGADDVPVKSLSVNIVPKQSGSGDPSPSNVRPISGWDEVEVVRKGKNLLDASAYDHASVLAYNDGVISNTNTDTRTAPQIYIATYKGQTQVEMLLRAVTMGAGNWNTTVTISNPDFNRISLWHSGSRLDMQIYFPFAVPTGTYTISCECMGNNPSVVGGWSFKNLQIEVGSTATAYEPYQGTSYPITLPSTVYGGELDVTSGVLTVTHKALNLGSVNWAKNNTSSDHWWFAYTTGDAKKASSSGSVADIICSNYKPISADQAWVGTQGIGVNNANTNIIVVDSTYSDTASFKTAMNGVMAVYELETPTTVQLTPTQVNTLLGSNNIYSSSGSVEVEYRADSTLAYNELLNAIANL